MKKITAKQIELSARACLAAGNPYLNSALVSYRGNEPRYHYAGSILTREELDAAYLETARKDVLRGYNERTVGYYDKWYRYCHADQGRAYDAGQRLAASLPGCPEDLQIIECLH